MDQDQFLTRVAERAGISWPDAEAVTRATLATLAQRITGGEARDLAAQLPVELQTPLLGEDEPAEAFSLVEFVRRVASRAGVSRAVANTGVVAVMTTLREAVSPGEFDDVISQLPSEFHGLTSGSRS
ncbi:DUF2267 domain-containing protein [Amycolatopsis acidiphila]|uniref:DUF2267 domain-containing protein n=1 Tax=Amycolatopsis acidiphila TaxID=715473 RepID=A0A558AL12_9PSEU|nr:DUF2267 domain-containing protein [Amycolatopsis acidiphila]TVT24952.1 DUF2267 domain-containing protein [Amycolatopsis acidiphila]UIJ57549.1 DUF2267 domain-containing protein [Amycolatopsis acidiphila]GHG89428.1 hypothetical protein GCM10017788_64160 [Amycolatopsis acidiphila]